MVVNIMLSNDIEILREKLYLAIEQGDEIKIYRLNYELDGLIVEFYKKTYSYYLS